MPGAQARKVRREIRDAADLRRFECPGDAGRRFQRAV